MTGVVQTSRGCPFECNFCDVIQYREELAGRLARNPGARWVIDCINELGRDRPEVRGGLLHALGLYLNK